MSELIDYQHCIDRATDSGLRVSLTEEPPIKSDNPFGGLFSTYARTRITIWKRRKKLFTTHSVNIARAFIAGYQCPHD